MIFVVCPHCERVLTSGEDAIGINAEEVIDHYKAFHPKRAFFRRFKVKAFEVKES